MSPRADDPRCHRWPGARPPPGIALHLGTASIDFQVRTLHELMEASWRGGNRIAFAEWDVNGALAALHGMRRATRPRPCLPRKWSPSTPRRCAAPTEGIGEHPAAGLQRQPRGQAAAHVHGADGGAAALPRQGRAEDDGRARSRPRRRPAIVGEVKAGSLGEGRLTNRRNEPMQKRLPMHLSRRCRARTRGTPCQSPAVHGKRRCRMHGGAAGSGGQLGNRNAFKHGAYSAALCVSGASYGR